MDDKLKRSQKQEKRGAQRYGGTRNAGSGSFWQRKSDVRLADVLIEYKRTDKRQITLKLADLEKNIEEALAEGRLPVLGIEIAGKHFVLLGEDDFDEFYWCAAALDPGDDA